MSDALRSGREAFAARRWTDAVASLTLADEPLLAEDLELLATAAHLVGDEPLSIDSWARAHRAHLDTGNPARAIRCAFALGMQLMTAGDEAQAGGWLARGHRLLDELPEDAPEHGLMRFPAGLQAYFDGRPQDALEHLAIAAEAGERSDDATLAALARTGQGQALIALGSVAEGLTRLDEAMVAVTSGEVGPIESGVIYCAVIEACHEIFDLDRAREWTDALTRWCEQQPDLVPFRGQCLVHRSEILQHRGDWPAATTEAARAAATLSEPSPQPALGAARYQQAEMHRLAGDTDLAEEAYRDAVAFGHSPHPGLALLRLQQGRDDDAWHAISRELEERSDVAARFLVLPAFVTIAVATDDVDAARGAAHELAGVASVSSSAMLQAVADHAIGAVGIAAGDPKGALQPLRHACARWQSLDVPYETARTRVLIGEACAALGDRDTAAIEWDAARRAFDDLGAIPDVEALDRVLTPGRGDRGGLTGREVEVLALVATGMTNRQVAKELVISEKTVARHLSNIFTKLDVSSRSAATAYAIKHGLA